MSGYTLRSLLTADAPTIARTPLPASAPAALYTAFVTDRVAFGLFAITNDEVGRLHVTVDGEPMPGEGVAVAVAGLRYFLTIDFHDTLERLCLTAGCDETRLGRRADTAFCDLHIAAGEFAGARLDTLEEEARKMREEGQGLGRIAEHLREGK
ncbi:hypothetical protein [Streptomyces diastaticus]